MQLQFVITEQEAGKRLDHVVVAHVPEVSRSTIQKWIVSGQVKLNSEKVSKHTFVDLGDTVDIDVAEARVTPLVRPADTTLQVIYSDESIVVIDKPVGMLVHPATQSNEWTVAHELTHLYPEIAAVGKQAERAGIVHRLDREVSGVMVAARTQEAYTALQAQFAARTIEKEYRAIVHGVPSRTHGDIRFVIARSSTQSGKMAARPEHAEGKDAWTEYAVIRSHRSLSELSVRIHTGRTHQIRAHMLSIGHPIVGDSLYASEQYDSNKTFARLFLHAYRLAFIHPVTGQRVEYISAVPQAFEDLMAF